MFGYVLPEKPELKIREYELFRAYYCGVCKSMGRRYGQLSRLTLTYDSTFLALLLSSLTGERVGVKKERCVAHPVKKRNVAGGSSLIDYASDMNIILAYYNLEDNWQDERSLLAGSAGLLLRGAFKKLYGKYEEKCGIIEQSLKELHVLEKQNCNSMDRAAEPFARLMEAVVSYPPLCADRTVERTLNWIGYNIGKWIYIIDAFDDLKKDMKSKAYNPLIAQFGLTPENLEVHLPEVREKVEFNLIHTLSQLGGAYELLGIKNNGGLLENIIYMGMLRKTEQVLNRTGSCKV